MKVRLLVLAVALSIAAAATAQQPPQGATQGALGWLQQQWKRVEESGRPMAEKIVREFPERFKDMRSQIANVSKMATKFSTDHGLPQKQALLVELWRVRGSLNLLSLLSPEMLHALTGMDTKTLQGMETEVSILRDRITKLTSSQ